MEEPYDYTQEDHAREVERVLMYIAQAQRKAEEIGEALAREDADERFVNGLRTAAAALLAEHNRLLNTTHFPVPDDPAGDGEAPAGGGRTLLDSASNSGEPETPSASDQQRMAL